MNPNPYSFPPQVPQQQPQTGPNKKVLALVAIPLLLCCVCGTGAVTVGMNMYSDEVCAHFKASDEMTERLGTISKCSVNTWVSMDLDDFDTFVFDVTGSKNQGRVWVKSKSNDEGHEVYEGVLLKIGNEETLIEGTRPPTK
ncbi:MAG: hypothetical protein QM817_09245 [Archangium sp.]